MAGELFGGEAEGFLHKHMFTSSQGLLHQSGVAVVAGGNHHGIGSWDRPAEAGTSVLAWRKPNLRPTCTGPMPGGGEGVEMSTGLGESRDKHAAGVVAGTNHAQRKARRKERHLNRQMVPRRELHAAAVDQQSQSIPARCRARAQSC